MLISPSMHQNNLPVASKHHLSPLRAYTNTTQEYIDILTYIYNSNEMTVLNIHGSNASHNKYIHIFLNIQK